MDEAFSADNAQERLEKFKKPEGYYSIPLDIFLGVTRDEDPGKLVFAGGHKDLGFSVLEPVPPGRDAQGLDPVMRGRVVADRFEETLADAGVDINRTYFHREGNPFHWHGYDPILGLPDIYRDPTPMSIVLVPEGCDWKPAAVMPMVDSPDRKEELPIAHPDRMLGIAKEYAPVDQWNGFVRDVERVIGKPDAPRPEDKPKATGTGGPKGNVPRTTP